MYKEIVNSKPTGAYGKFIRLFLKYKLSFYGQGKSYGNKEYLNSNYESKYNDRLKHTTILNTDYKNLIKKYDSSNTLFYLDPPYEKSDKLYTHDSVPISDVYNFIKNIKGKFVLSYNDSKEAKDLFKAYKIKRVKTRYGLGAEGGQQNERTELIITNF